MQITKSQIESELHRLAELIGAQTNQLPIINNSKEAWPVVTDEVRLPFWSQHLAETTSNIKKYPFSIVVTTTTNKI
jgi:hypothetical protein